MPTAQLTAMERLSQASDAEIQQIWSSLDELGDGHAPGPYSDTPTNNDWAQMVLAFMEQRGLDKTCRPKLCDYCETLQPTEKAKVKGFDLLAGWEPGDADLYMKEIIVPHKFLDTDQPCLYNTEVFPSLAGLR